MRIRTLKRGQQRCFVHLGKQADYDRKGKLSSTPSDVHQNDEMGRLEKVSCNGGSFKDSSLGVVVTDGLYFACL